MVKPGGDALNSVIRCEPSLAVRLQTRISNAARQQSSEPIQRSLKIRTTDPAKPVSGAGCDDRMRHGCRIRAYTDVFTACRRNLQRWLACH
jgi:hypothetical protein